MDKEQIMEIQERLDFLSKTERTDLIIELIKEELLDKESAIKVLGYSELLESVKQEAEDSVDDERDSFDVLYGISTEVIAQYVSKEMSENQ